MYIIMLEGEQVFSNATEAQALELFKKTGLTARLTVLHRINGKLFDKTASICKQALGF